MENKHEVLRQRTKQFALRILHLFRSLPKSKEGRIIGRQLLRAGTAVAANYRAVGRARSRAEFIAKMGIVVEETDEVVFWLELIAEGRLVPSPRLADLQKEANELLAIFASSQHTAKTH
ncbi:MAG TPA: four helix bundle protein [Terriglobia bacterium]|nr:four helix bundle protein [Terriglobia bacterium]